PQDSGLRLGTNVDDMLKHIGIDNLEHDFIREEQDDNLSLTLSYSKMSKDVEEVVIVKTEGAWAGKKYRIIRSDGGFDTGFVPLKSKFTEFLPLLTNVNNTFYLRVYDEQQNEIKTAVQEIVITQGQFNIAGQPLPQDICIEVDDKENNATKLEVIFAKNAVLPQKKTLYREISKTIKQGSDDRIVINILEGDRF